MAHPGSTPAQQLAQFERLLDQADPERPADLARLEATLLRLLERLAARRRPLPVRSDRERIDARATLREYLRQGEFLSRLVYRERPRQRQLVILVDLSESFGPFALWGAAVAVAAKRVAPGVAIWGFGAGLWPLEAECADLASFMAAYRRLRGRSRLSLAGLPALLGQVARETTGAARVEVWAVSDLLLAPGQALDLSPAAVERARRALRPFARLRVLDPTTIYTPYEDEAGCVSVNGRQLGELLQEETAWTVAESERSVQLDLRALGLLADRYSDVPLLQARRATPWLRALAADAELGRKVDLIARRAGASSLHELFFGGQATWPS